MKDLLFKKLFFVKLMLLVAPSTKRQIFIDDLNSSIESFASQFNKKEINKIKRQIASLPEADCESLFSNKSFAYRLLKFGKIRLDVDSFNIEKLQTFKQFNYCLKVALAVIDYDKHIEKLIKLKKY